jgi:NNP family nitrate/nitrite transporter-like MFS transporter
MADEWGAARVTFWTFVAMMLAAAAALTCLPGGAFDEGDLAGFLASSFALFLASGVGNGAVFRLIPASYASPAEGAAALGLASALGAGGGFFIPLICAASLGATSSAMPALAAFVLFYATCATVAGGAPESPNPSRSDP